MEDNDMRTIGNFYIEGTYVPEIGNHVADTILGELETGETTINDSAVREFLYIIFGEGNFEFLRHFAKQTYNDSRKDIVLDFIDLVKETAIQGKKELNSRH